MSLLRLIGKISIALQVFVFAVLLPALHIHTQVTQGGEGNVTHKHALAHADFFPGAHDQGTGEAEHENNSSANTQISFSGVVSRWIGGHLSCKPGDAVGLLSRQPIHSPEDRVRLNRVGSERSPPILDALRTLLSPRAPPQFSVL